SSHDTGAGYLSHRLRLDLPRSQNRRTKRGGLSNFEDNYEPVGGYYILCRRAIETATDGGSDVQEFVFSNITLLEAA
ncbi:MAG: DUF3386 family protein, partial [Leptolyngbyaceae cyanobacterium SM2_5_2]|nr:DUF3386 family protein [Leptolyngbyaceae cyanobacterium SM2_5_2]